MLEPWVVVELPARWPAPAAFGRGGRLGEGGTVLADNTTAHAQGVGNLLDRQACLPQFHDPRNNACGEWSWQLHRQGGKRNLGLFDRPADVQAPFGEANLDH